MTTSLHTASAFRENFFSLLKSVVDGIEVPEISLREQAETVVMLPKSEYDALLETLDIQHSPTEMSAIKHSRKTAKTLTHEDVSKALEL